MNTFHKTDEISVKKNAFLIFWVFSLPLLVMQIGKSMALPKLYAGIIISVYLLALFSFLFYMYRFLDPLNQKDSLHPDLAGVSTEIRSKLLSIYANIFIFVFLLSSLSLNLLSLDMTNVWHIVVYLTLLLAISWLVYRIPDRFKIEVKQNAEKKQLSPDEIAASDEKSANFVILMYILGMALIAFLLFKNGI
jgi:Ca2+/Na+ antiporter